MRIVLCRIAVASILGFALGSCGDAGTVEIAVDREAGPATRVTVVRDQIDAVYQSWAGEELDLQARELVGAYQENGPFSDCMRAEGFDVPWQQTVSAVGPVDSLAGTRILMDPVESRRSVSEAALNEAQESIREAMLKRDPSEQEMAAGDVCLTLNPPTGGSDIEDPAVLDRLDHAWQKMIVETTEPITGTAATYAGCVAGIMHANIDSSSGRSYEEMMYPIVQDLLDKAPPIKDRPVGPGADQSSQWADFLKAEASFADASWHCAKPSYEEAIMALETATADFVRDNKSDIASAQAYWTKWRMRAEPLGLSQ